MTAFYLLAALAVVSSMLVIAQRNPVYSVLLLIASFGALSGLYVLLDAPFVAVIQIIVYAGAIMVLFLFVVMLLNAPHEDTDYDVRRHPLLRPGPLRLGAAVSLVFAVELIWALTSGRAAGGFGAGSVTDVATACLIDVEPSRSVETYRRKGADVATRGRGRHTGRARMVSIREVDAHVPLVARQRATH